MRKALMLAAVAALIAPAVSMAQNPCDNPVPGNCHVPDTCCILPNNECPFVVGDMNGNGTFNGIDVTYFVNFLKGGPDLPPPFSRGDVNGSCSVNGLDLTYMVQRWTSLKCSVFICTDSVSIKRIPPERPR